MGGRSAERSWIGRDFPVDRLVAALALIWFCWPITVAAAAIFLAVHLYLQGDTNTLMATFLGPAFFAVVSGPGARADGRRRP